MRPIDVVRKQQAHNEANNIVPKGVIRKITDVMDVGATPEEQLIANKVAEQQASYQVLSFEEIEEKIKQLEATMLDHAKNLEFEQAAALRDDIAKLRAQQLQR